MKHELHTCRSRTALVKQVIDEHPCRSVLDVGAGHCVFSILASTMGKTVVAVDARRDRVPEDLHGVEFIQGDATRMDLPAADLTLCLGLFYHLTHAEQLRLLRQLNGRVVLLETHYCDGMATDWATGKPGEFIVIDGLVGCIYREGDSLSELQSNPKASFTSLEAFWPTEQSLMEMLASVGGYGTITKYLPELHPHRAFYLCQQ